MLSSSKYTSLVLLLGLTSTGVALGQTAAPTSPAAPAAAPTAAPTAAPAPAPAAAPPPVAETAPPPVQEPAPAAEPAPTEAPPPVEQTAPPPPVSEPPPAESSEPAPYAGPTKQASLYMGSPIWMSNAPLDPGFEFELRSGIKMGILVPEIGLGARWNWTNVDKIREGFPEVNAPELYAGENLTSFWFSLGLRVEPKMKGKIQPYLSGAFDMLMWGASYDTTEFCGLFTCSTVRDYEFAPGFSSRVGVRINPKPFIGIDLGAKIGMSFPGWAFQDTQSWVEPYAGLTLIMGKKPR